MHKSSRQQKGKPNPATNLPAPIALAATWDAALARQYGDLLGQEMVATAHNVLFGPALDIARVPVGGRIFESFGEDPLLKARLVAAEVPAIQAHGVQACIKHFVVNNQEYQRSTVDVRVDDRALQEIYLLPFAAAVQQGQAAAVMGSHNQINGVFACEHPSMLTTILRGQWGFRGWVISDYAATPSTASSANAGLDWELGETQWGEKLTAAVQASEVSRDQIHAMVRRILRPAYGLGQHKRAPARGALPIMDHGAQAQAIAKQGIVLLKHEGDLLPLSTTNLRSITVIGPDADNVSAAGGGSAAVKPAYAVSVLDALRQRTGDGVRVAYAPGADPIGPGVLLPGLPAIPAAYFSPPVGGEGAAGVRAAYWSNLDFSGEPDLVRQEPRIELHQNLFEIIPGPKVASPKLPPAPVEEGVHGRLSARWTGTLTAPVSGEYTLSLTVQGTARLRLNEELILDSTTAALASSSNPRVPPGSSPAEWPACALKIYLTTVRLTAGRPNVVQVEYAADAREVWPMPQAMLRLGWQPPADVVTPEMETAAELARQSDVALVVVRTKATPDELGRPAVTGYTDRIRQETPWLGNICWGNDRQRGG